MLKKLYLPVLLLGVSISSCTSYKFLFFESNGSKDDNMEFVFENDTIDVRYRFTGWDVPVNIYIYNKSDEPLYVDWTQSAMVLNGRNIGYWQDIKKIGADLGYSSMNGTIEGKKETEFIAPKSYIESTRVSLLQFVPEDFSKAKKYKVKMRYEEGYKLVDKYDFNKEDSPMQMRSHITFSADPNFQDKTYLESEFWLSRVIDSPSNSMYMIDTRNNYTNYKSSNNKPGNVSVISETSGSGGFGLFALSAATILLIVMPDDVEQQ